MSKEDRKERITDFIKNVWTVRHWFITKYGVDPAMYSSDQMPLHRNESSGQATLNFKGQSQSTYVKENHMLSLERAAVMTTASSQAASSPPSLEFIFKGKGIRVNINPPQGVNVQWAEKGSYRLEHLLKFVSTLKSQPVLFRQAQYKIYTLDDYSVHLCPEVKAALYKNGYFLIVMGGGITGDLQVNDTDYHRPLKREYRNLEQELMIKLLTEEPNKIPSPKRDDMMRMISEAWSNVQDQVDSELAFKRNMISVALDGSEDYLISPKLRDVVGEELFEWRKCLMNSTPVESLKLLEKQMIAPKGVTRKSLSDKVVIPLDEGEELYDGEILEVQNIPDEEYDILDNIDNDVEIDISIEGASTELLEQTEEDIPVVESD